MSNLNLNEYYSKISDIRHRILSKHKNRPETADLTFSSGQPREERNPLCEKAQQPCNVNFRVKELDDINGKIKNVLSERRSVQKGNAERERHENVSIISKIDTTYKKRLNFDDRRQQLSNEPAQTKPYQKQQRDYKAPAPQNIPIPIPIPRPIEQPLSSLPVREVHQSDFSCESLSTRGRRGAKEELVRLLLAQVELDTKLRGLKEQFQLFNNPDKQRLLASQLRGRSELAPWLQLWPEERNPFLSATAVYSFEVGELVESAARAKQHWECVVREGTSIGALERERFTIGEIDPQGKGYLAVQDLVCFLNMNSESCLRNRDLISLFRRLDAGGRVGYVCFLNFVAK